jgi:hypothetical protein
VLKGYACTLRTWGEAVSAAGVATATMCQLAAWLANGWIMNHLISCILHQSARSGGCFCCCGFSEGSYGSLRRHTPASSLGGESWDGCAIWLCCLVSCPLVVVYGADTSANMCDHTLI